MKSTTSSSGRKRNMNLLVNPGPAEGAGIAVWLLQVWKSRLVKNHWVLGHPFLYPSKIILYTGTKSHEPGEAAFQSNAYLPLLFGKQSSKRTHPPTHTHAQALLLFPHHKGNEFQNKPNPAVVKALPVQLGHPYEKSLAEHVEGSSCTQRVVGKNPTMRAVWHTGQSWECTHGCIYTYRRSYRLFPDSLKTLQPCGSTSGHQKEMNVYYTLIQQVCEPQLQWEHQGSWRQAKLGSEAAWHHSGCAKWHILLSFLPLFPHSQNKTKKQQKHTDFVRDL